ncbi:hypothetical protein [Arcobacter sp.]
MKKSVEKALKKSIQSLFECREEVKGKRRVQIDRAIGHLLMATKKKK